MPKLVSRRKPGPILQPSRARMSGSRLSPGRQCFSSNDPALPEARDLFRAVAEFPEDRVIVRPEFGGHANLGGRFGKLPWRAVDFQRLAVFRVLDLGDIAVGDDVGIVGS